MNVHNRITSVVYFDVLNSTEPLYFLDERELIVFIFRRICNMQKKLFIQ